MPLQTVDDALTLMEYLARTGTFHSLSAICRDRDLSKARAYRLLATLKTRDYVVQDPYSRQYGFGPACARLVGDARQGVTVTAACADATRWLWSETEETTYLAVFEAGQAVVIDKLDSPKPVVATSALGRVLPLHTVSAGKVLLASRPDSEIENLITSLTASHIGKNATFSHRLWADIQKVRRERYAVNREGFRDGVSGVAAPVRWGQDGSVVAAMAVCVPEVRFSDSMAHLRMAVLKAADMASHSLELAALPQEATRAS